MEIRRQDKEINQIEKGGRKMLKLKEELEEVRRRLKEIEVGKGREREKEERGERQKERNRKED